MFCMNYGFDSLDFRDGGKTFSIQNRRYLGNKFKLLPFIQHVVQEECINVGVVADIFSGTGAFSSAFLDKIVITNDLLYSNYICNLAWFGSEFVRLRFLRDILEKYNNLENLTANYMTENFSDTYFSEDDCTRIGFVREDIEMKFRSGVINERERAVLIASLIYAMDHIAKTCGHYDAYRKGIIFDKHLKLFLLNVPERNFSGNCCFNEDANELVKRIQPDLVYIDPPYNSRQYSDTYHLLENVACWKKPKVFGVARKMSRIGLKSDYCTRRAVGALEDLVSNIRARYILMSYNNMASKGNTRSNARILDEDILNILSSRGKVEVFSKRYKSFSAGKSDIKGNEERLFFCEVR